MKTMGNGVPLPMPPISGGIDEFFGDQPFLCGVGVAADQEDFLDGAGGGVEAFQAGFGGVLDFEAGWGFAAAAVDSAGDDAGDVGAVFDDVVEEGIEPADAAVLAFDAAEFHGCIMHKNIKT
jgi:hypothetical protein